MLQLLFPAPASTLPPASASHRARRRACIGLAASLMLLWTAAGPATAQSAGHASAPRGRVEVSTGIGGGRLWDDETGLGAGPVLLGGVALPIGGFVLVSGTADWFPHTRDLESLRIRGQVASAFARGTLVFGSARQRVRPLAGVGVGLVHSTGTLSAPPRLPGPPGQPPGALEDTPWSVTHRAYEVHAGLRARLGERLFLHPEFRWRSTTPGRSNIADGIELPLWSMQGVVSLGLRLF